MSTIAFLRTDVEALFDHLQTFGPGVRERIEAYRAALDPRIGTVYDRRRLFEESVTRIADGISSYLDLEEQTAQAMFPHYFEKQKTDGVDHQIYVGASLLEDGRFDPLYLKSLRLWQLMVTCGIALRANRLKDKLPVPLEVTHLVLVQHAPLSIRFRFDEKRFDVDGAYDIRYEIVKKRIDKAVIRGTEERITQPGKIAIIYAHSAARRTSTAATSSICNRSATSPARSRTSSSTSCRACTGCARSGSPSTCATRGSIGVSPSPTCSPRRVVLSQLTRPSAPRALSRAASSLPASRRRPGAPPPPRSTSPARPRIARVSDPKAAVAVAGTKPPPSIARGGARTRMGPSAGMSQIVEHPVGERLLVVEKLERQLDAGRRDAGRVEDRLPLGGRAPGEALLDLPAELQVVRAPRSRDRGSDDRARIGSGPTAPDERAPEAPGSRTRRRARRRGSRRCGSRR